MEPTRYESRGVSSDKKEVHQAIKMLDPGLYKNAFCKILADPFASDDDSAMILHADTAGTKTILAYLYWRETGDLSVWKGIAQDALVMNVDDMACSGATSEFVISNTILRNKKLIPSSVLEAIIQGTMDFVDAMAKEGIKIHHAGGETADVGDVIRTIDVGFTAYTKLPRKKVFLNNIQAGDLILGLGSYGQTTYEASYNSGISCNGLTSARHDVLAKYYATAYPESYDPGIDDALVYSGQHRLTDQIWDKTHMMNRQVGQLLLSPTRTFVPFLHQVFALSTEGLHGIIHATGGAHSKVLKFSQGVKIIKDRLLTPPVIFDLIQQCSNATVQEMYKVFNMGTRLELYGTSSRLDSIQNIATQFNIPCQIIGRVEQTSYPSIVEVQVGKQSWTYQE